jgi:hypothetical protein
LDFFYIVGNQNQSFAGIGVRSTLLIFGGSHDQKIEKKIKIELKHYFILKDLFHCTRLFLLYRFPKDFIWGAATSAHQGTFSEVQSKKRTLVCALINSAHTFNIVEGNSNNNNWSQFERLGRVKQRSGLACNHWELYPLDIQLMKQLGLDAYR